MLCIAEYVCKRVCLCLRKEEGAQKHVCTGPATIMLGCWTCYNQTVNFVHRYLTAGCHLLQIYVNALTPWLFSFHPSSAMSKSNDKIFLGFTEHIHIPQKILWKRFDYCIITCWMVNKFITNYISSFFLYYQEINNWILSWKNSQNKLTMDTLNYHLNSLNVVILPYQQLNYIVLH